MTVRTTPSSHPAIVRRKSCSFSRAPKIERMRFELACNSSAFSTRQEERIKKCHQRSRQNSPRKLYPDIFAFAMVQNGEMLASLRTGYQPCSRQIQRSTCTSPNIQTFAREFLAL